MTITEPLYTINLTQQEIDTITAALRLWFRLDGATFVSTDRQASFYLDDYLQMAHENGPALSVEQVLKLCEELNR